MELYRMTESGYTEDRKRYKCIYESEKREKLEIIYPISEIGNIKTVINFIGIGSHINESI